MCWRIKNLYLGITAKKNFGKITKVMLRCDLPESRQVRHYSVFSDHANHKNTIENTFNKMKTH